MKRNHLKKAAVALLSTFLVFTMASCYEAEDYKMSESVDIAYDAQMNYSGGFEEEIAYEKTEDSLISDNIDGSAYSERKIIYNSFYRIDTEEYEKSISALDTLCEKYGAYYERVEKYGQRTEYTSRWAEFVVRIPKNNYKAFISETGNVGTVTRSSEENRDVTEQYFDTEARLESAKIREERLLQILSKSEKLDDVLMLERELADVRYEIENYSGTLRKYDSLVSYSTATVTISEVKKVAPPVTEKTGLSQKLSSALQSGFDAFYGGLTVVLMGIVFCLPGLLFVVLPVVIAVIIIAVVVVRKIKKKKNKKNKTEE